MKGKPVQGWRAFTRPSVPALDGAQETRKRYACISGESLAFAAALAVLAAKENVPQV